MFPIHYFLLGLTGVRQIPSLIEKYISYDLFVTAIVYLRATNSLGVRVYVAGLGLRDNFYIFREEFRIGNLFGIRCFNIYCDTVVIFLGSGWVKMP